MDDRDFDLAFLEEASDQYFENLKRFKEARFRLGLRGGLMLVGLVVGLYFIFISMDDVGFYFKDSAKVVELGDLRSSDFDYSIVQSIYTNDLVSFENDVIVFDDLQSQDVKYYFYFSPVTNFVVRTEKELPDKEVIRIASRVVEIDSFGASMVAQRKAFPEDLAVSFSAHGRILADKDIPEWADPILSYMSNSSGVPKREMRLFLDGVEPSEHAPFLYLIIGAILLMLGTVVFFTDAMVRYLRSRRLLRNPAS
jgi:hypothetical protein